MYHYVYKITNLVNDKIYVGKHSTKNIDNDYMGSGTCIAKAIQKYGIANFRKDILAYFDTSDAAFDFERKLVTEDFVKRDDVYNVISGGLGFDSRTARIQARRLHKEGKLKPPNWSGRKHSAQTREKMKLAKFGKQAGSENSQFGTYWIRNPSTKETKKIRSVELATYAELGWERGRYLTK